MKQAIPQDETYRYEIIMECPDCGEKTHVVAATEHPVDLMQHVPHQVEYCTHCGHSIEEWNIHSEYEIERVLPTQERER